MTCKHCGEPIVENPVRRSPEPFVYRKWKHAETHLIACYDSNANKLGTVAEPKENQ
jgi:hypothetical protein